MQKYTSKNTSLNQVPALHKKLVNLQKAGKHIFSYFNFVNGAGRFQTATRYLRQELDTINIRFDPYNLPECVNRKIADYIGFCETSTIANVLNVIQEEEEQIKVLQRSFDMLYEFGTCYISVYEGDKSGVGKVSKNDCWQNNKKTADYVETVKKVFPYVKVKYGIIIASKEDFFRF